MQSDEASHGTGRSRRRRYGRVVVKGAAVGAVLSVLPPMLLGPVAFVAAGLHAAWCFSELGKRKVPGPALVGALCAAAILLIAWAMPVKYVHTKVPVELTARVLTVGEFMSQVERHPFADRVPEGAGDLVVHLPSRRPVWQEVDAALQRDAGLRLHFGYCGTSATALFGAYPIGGPQLRWVEPTSSSAPGRSPRRGAGPL